MEKAAFGVSMPGPFDTFCQAPTHCERFGAGVSAPPPLLSSSLHPYSRNAIRAPRLFAPRLQVGWGLAPAGPGTGGA